MVAVLEVEAEGDVDAVLEEDIADGTVDDVVDGPGLAGNKPDLYDFRRIMLGGVLTASFT